MQLPAALRQAIEARLAGRALGAVRADSAALTGRYRGGRAARPAWQAHVRGAADAEAYIAARLPATYAAAASVLAEVAARLPDFAPASLLDLGAGPGTMLWAAAEAWPGLAGATLLDNNPAFREIGAALAAAGPAPAFAAADWRPADLEGDAALPEADLATAAYVLNELSPAAQARTVAALWRAARGAVVLIEPGTPAGFAHLRAARRQLLDLGARLVAPCPHGADCPLTGEDWCHFSRRVERSRLQRLAKGAAAPFEDEKFAYLAAARVPSPAVAARVLRPPRVEKGAVTLDLCRADGTAGPQAVPRRDKAAYRAAERLGWGDAVEPEGA
ncbi:MAG TPA: small ribosomal subunit Rsm22 family protein [Alphaproteobacteria bacterium]|nr:small ribosomal subunit Rsm22 family protein [Alphaproteobacteria bacterium]